MPPIKGTYVRNAWDWYKGVGAIAHDETVLIANSHQSFAFQNDGAPGMIFDLFRLEIDAQGPNTINVWTAKLNPAFTPDVGAPAAIIPLLNTESPVKASWAISTAALSGAQQKIINSANMTDRFILELASGGAFLRLNSGYALFSDIATGAASHVVNVNVWFQPVLM